MHNSSNNSNQHHSWYHHCQHHHHHPHPHSHHNHRQSWSWSFMIMFTMILGKIWWPYDDHTHPFALKMQRTVLGTSTPPQDTMELPSTRESNSVRQASALFFFWRKVDWLRHFGYEVGESELLSISWSNCVIECNPIDQVTCWAPVGRLRRWNLFLSTGPFVRSIEIVECTTKKWAPKQSYIIDSLLFAWIGLDSFWFAKKRWPAVSFW